MVIIYGVALELGQRLGRKMRILWARQGMLLPSCGLYPSNSVGMDNSPQNPRALSARPWWTWRHFVPQLRFLGVSSLLDVLG